MPEVLPHVEENEPERESPHALDAEPVEEAEAVGAGPFGRDRGGPGEDPRRDGRVENAQCDIRGVVPDPLPLALEHGNEPLEEPHGAQSGGGQDGLVGEERLGHWGLPG